VGLRSCYLSFSMVDRKLSPADLSEDQKEVFDAIMDWTRGEVGMATPKGWDPKGEVTGLLRVGGYAGCLSGDTIVNYNRGSRLNYRKITLKDLYLKFNGFSGSGRGAACRWVDLTMPTYLLSLWPNGLVSGNRVVAVFESGLKPTLRLDFSNGEHLVLTEDHPVATPGQEYIKAGELHKGDLVLARTGTRTPKGGKGRDLDARPPRVIVNTKYHQRGSVKYVTCNGVTYRYMRVARARFVEAAMNNISYDEYVHALKHNEGASKKFKYLSGDVDVHHMDEDTLNDDITNLEVLPSGEHARIHGREEGALRLQQHALEEVKITKITKAGTVMTYDVQMEPPANNFAANNIFVHNSGKSTLLGVLASTWDLQVAFCSFTGRASSILERKLKACGVKTTSAPFMDPEKMAKSRFAHLFSSDPSASYCGTIHRLLYRPVINSRDELVGFAKRDRLDRDYDLVVIDEASMVGDDMLEDLRRHGVPILAVGDHGQLPPVQASGSLMQDPDLRLEKIHRQAAGSPIIQLAHWIREGNRFGSFKGWDKNVRKLSKTKVDEVLTDDAVGGLSRGILCWTNKNRCILNSKARRALGRKGKPSAGEILIALKNDPPVFNGMRGVLVSDVEKGSREWTMRGKIEFPDEGLAPASYEMAVMQFMRERTLGNVDEVNEEFGLNLHSAKDLSGLFDFGYCLTTHKSQGSQFDHAIVYCDMPEKGDEMTRRYYYTAVTRASRSLSVLT